MFNLEEFKKPQDNFYPAPFWFWNDILPYDELEWQMEQMKEQHIYEFFIHARKGLLVEYLSEEWLSRIAFVIEVAKRLNMKIWLYDEDNFPSGYAGGKVIADNPDFCGKNLKVLVVKSYDEFLKVKDKNIISAFSKIENRYIKLNINEIECSFSNFDEIYLFIQEYTLWHPAYSDSYYIDVLNEKACESFIKHTHKVYEERFGEYFGTIIKGFFSDEAGFYNNLKLIPWSNTEDSDTIVWTDSFIDYFIKRNGYDITDLLPWLFYNLENSHIYRRDFYETTCDMYLENFLMPQRNFCEERGMYFVGHLHMEDYLSYHVVGHGNFTRALNGLSYAGTDRIDQNNEKINEKVVSSFGHQYNKPRVLSETYALTSWALDFTEMRRIANYQYVRGVNMIVQHAFYASIREERKWECPPSQFYQNPYWKHYSHFSDYIARLSYALTCGEHVAELAIYYPIANAQCRQTPFDWQCSEDHDIFLQNIANSLLEAQYDFDFINDEAFVNIENNLLKVNNENYKAIIIPDVEYMPYKTLSKLYELCINGGVVIFIRNLPKYCTESGMQEQFIELLDKLVKLPGASVMTYNMLYKAYTYKFSAYNLFEYTSMKNAYKKDFSIDRANSGIKYLHRRDNNIDIYFITNEIETQFKHTCTFNVQGEPLLIDPISGRGKSIDYTVIDGKMQIDLTFKEYDGVIIVFNLDVAQEKSSKLLSNEVLIKDISSKLYLSLNNKTYSGPLKSWSDYGHPYYSGEGIYTVNIILKKCDNSKYLISLGEVCDLAEVLVNGIKVDVLLYKPYELDISNFIIDGENQIEIRVINSIINEFETKAKKSGLIGPVELKIYGKR